MAKTPSPAAAQQGSSTQPSQQQGQSATTPPQQGARVIKDWASI